nr:VCBS repeat-containing protein [Nannocystis sp. ILAH1]
MEADRRARRGVSPWTRLVSALGLGALALACQPADPCAHTGAGALCLDLAGARTYTWGLTANATVVADLDGDGRPDLVVGGGARGTVGVFWGRADARGVQDMFDGTATSWSIGSSTQDLAVADLDGDGRLDVATALPGRAEIVVLRGQGGRALAEPERIAVGDGPRRIVAADLDAAGPSELVVVSETAGAVTVVRGLVADPPVSVGTGARDLAIADLDSDGHLDVAVAVADAGAVQVLLGDGHGGLVTGPRHAVSLAPTAVVAADLDRDGAIDLATLDVLADDVTILHGDGQGRLRARSRWPIDPEPHGLTVAPGDDGQPALFVLSDQTGNIQRIDPRRGVVLTGTPPAQPNHLLVGDLDGDGRDSLLYAGFAAGLGELVPARGLRVEPLWQRQRTGGTVPLDIDADGVDELLIDLEEQPEPDPSAPIDPEDPPSRTLKVARGSEALDLELDSNLGGPLRGAVAADFDGDDRNDLVLWDGRTIAVLRGLPDGTFAPGVPALQPSEPRAYAVVHAADRDRLVFADNLSLQALHLGSDGALAVEGEVSLDDFPVGLSAVDLAGDGRTDLVVHLSDSMLLIEDLQLDAPRRIDSPASARTVDLLLVPGEHPRRDAMVCANPGLVLMPDLFGPSPGAPVVLDPLGCERLALFDLDGDGRRTEVVALSTDGPASGVQRVVLTPWLRDDHAWRSLASRAVAEAFGAPRLIQRGGGRLALLRHSSRSELVAEDMSLGPAIAARPRTRLSSGFGAEPGDFDGDGAIDLFLHSGLFSGASRHGFAFGDGDGGFGPTELQSDFLAADVASLQVLAFQLDDDPAEELVLTLRSLAQDHTELVRVDLEDGEPRLQRLLRFPSQRFVNFFPGDLDGDGRLDLFVVGPVEALAGGPVGPAGGVGGKTVRRTANLRGVEGGFAEARWDELELGESFNVGGLIELDGDGRLDLLSYSFGLDVASGLGDGRFQAPRRWTEVNPYDFAVGDLDRDGRPDMAAVVLLISAPPGFQQQLLWLRGGVTAAPPQAIFNGARSVDIADMDGDGELDLLVAGNDDAVHVGRYRDGGFRFDRYPVPGGSQIMRVRDVDDDGLRDLIGWGTGSLTIVRQLP